MLVYQYGGPLEHVDSLEWGDRMNAEQSIGTEPGFYDTAKDCRDYRPDVDCPREGVGDRRGDSGVLHPPESVYGFT